MRLSRNAIGNLIAKYSAILKKCAVINVLAAGLLLGGMHGVAGAINIADQSGLEEFLSGSEPTGTLTPSSGDSISTTWNLAGCSMSNLETKTLDFDGKTLSGTQGGIAVGPNYTLTVSGGTMSGFQWALEATGTGKLSVSNMTLAGIADTNRYGCGVHSESSVDVSGSNFGITAANEMDSYGVEVESTTSSVSSTITGSSFNVSVSDGSAGYGVSVQSDKNSSTATISNSSFVVTGDKGKAFLFGVAVSGSTATAIISNSSFVVGGSSDEEAFYGVAVGGLTATATISNSSFVVGFSEDGDSYGVFVATDQGENVGTATITNSSFSGTGTGICAQKITFHGANTVNSIMSDGTISNDGTLTLSRSLDGIESTCATLNNTGTINMSPGATATVSSLAGNGNLVIGVNLNTPTTASKITVNESSTGAVVNLTDVNIVGDIYSGAGGETYITYVGGDGASSITYKIAGSEEEGACIKVPTGDYVYIFTLGKIKGTLDLEVVAGGPSIQEFIQGNNFTDSSFSMTNDMPLSADLGTTHRDNEQRELTINFNGHTMDGASHDGVTVADGYTLNLSGGTNPGVMTGFTTAATVEGEAVLNVANMTFEDNGTDIANDGTVNFSGTNKLDKLTGAGSVTNSGSLDIPAGGDLSAAKVSLSGGNISVAGTFGTKDTTLSFDGGNLVFAGGSVYAKDSNILVSSGYVGTEGKLVSDAAAQAMGGSSGNLSLWLTQPDTTYTASYLKKTTTALFEGTKCGLVFLNGNLQLEQGEILVAKATTEGKTATLSGASGVQEIEGGAGNGVKVPGMYTANAVLKDAKTGEKMDAPEKLSVDGVLAAKGIEVANVTVTSVTIEAKKGSIITLTGDTDREKSVIVKDNVQTPTPTNFKVGENSVLNFGIADNDNFQKATVTDVEIADNATHNVAGNGIGKTDFTYESLEVGKAEVNVSNAKVEVKELESNGGAIVTKNSDFTAKTATLAGGTSLSVLNGSATIEKLEAKSGAMFIDPAYLKIGSLEGEFDSALFVSDGSVVNVGSDTDMLKAAAAKAGFQITEKTTGFVLEKGYSMLALNDNVNLGSSGKIVVDDKVDKDGLLDGKVVEYDVYFGDDSLLAVNGEKVSGTAAAITGSGTGTKAFIADGAKLYIANAQAGGEYYILNVENIDSGTDQTGWNGANLLTDSDMLDATFHYSGEKQGRVTITSNSAKDAYPRLDGELIAIVDKLYAGGLNDAYSDVAGIRFLSRATNKAFIGANSDDATAAMESVSRIGSAGAVPQMSLMASETLSDAMGNRMNIAGGYNAIQEQGFTRTFALWITPLWKNRSGFGMEACNLDYGFNANIGGVALGADWLFAENWKAGLAFNIGGGRSESSGDLSKTTNRMNFWGVGIYGGYNDGTLTVSADVSYTGTYNKLEQDMDSRMYMKDAKADVQASVWAAGLRGDYKFSFDVMDVTPHVGIRFQSVSSQEYDVKAGGTVAKSDGISQTIWSVPVGVTFAKDFTTEKGWAVTPSVDFSVTPRFGDLKAYESIRYAGVDGEAGLRTQTRDYITYKGTAGIGAKRGNIGLGLNYSYEGGSRTSGHGVNASFRWEF